MPNVKQDFVLVITEINKMRQELVAAQKAARENAAAVQRGTREAVSGYDQAKRSAREYATAIDQVNKSAKAAQFGTAPGAAANIQNTTRLMNQQRFAVFQLTSGVQDAAIAFQMMGFTTQGWTMAMRGASNNLGVMLSTMGPLTAITGTLALIAGPPLISWLLKLTEGAKFSAEAIAAVGSAALQSSKHFETMREAIHGAEEAQRSLTEAMQPEAEAKDIKTEEQAKAEELRTFMRKGGGEMKASVAKAIDVEVEQRTRQESEALESRRVAGLGQLYQMTGGASPNEKQLARRLRLLDMSQRFKTPEEIDLAVKQGLMTKDEGEMLKARLGITQDERAFEKKKQDVLRDVRREFKEKISRGEVPEGVPISQEEIDRAGETTAREQAHADLVKKQREARKKLDTARDQEAKDLLAEQARPLQERSAEIRRELGLSPRERALGHLPKLSKRERLQLELEQQGIQRRLEAFREQEQDIGWQAHQRERERRGIAPTLPAGAPQGQAQQDKQMEENNMHLRTIANTFAFGFANTINRNAQL
jgi:hypothetical protein